MGGVCGGVGGSVPLLAGANDAHTGRFGAWLIFVVEGAEPNHAEWQCELRSAGILGGFGDPWELVRL